MAKLIDPDLEWSYRTPATKAKPGDDKKLRGVSEDDVASQIGRQHFLVLYLLLSDIILPTNAPPDEAIFY
jgi:hypothetical protein